MAKVLLVLAIALHGEACSRVLVNKEAGLPVVSARTMDWAHSFNDNLQINPRGLDMDGGAGEGYSKRWVSKYGSVSATVNSWLSQHINGMTGEKFDFYKDGASEAVNEKGLAAHILYLETSEYPSLVKKPIGVTYMRWARYIVDNFATVAEAVASLQDISIVGVKMVSAAFPNGATMGLHVAMEDSSGDSAIIEFMHGQMQIYHGRSQNYSVLTNDPALPLQLQNLKRYTPFGGDEPLPGDTTSMERFVRMTYFLSYMPESRDSTVMAGYLRSVIMESAVPQGAPDHESSGYAVSPTWYVSIIDFQKNIYYWSWTLNPNVIWVDLNRLDREGAFDNGKPYALLNPRESTLAGDVGSLFRASARAPQTWFSTSSSVFADAPFLLRNSPALMLIIMTSCVVIAAGLAAIVEVGRRRKQSFAQSCTEALLPSSS